MTLQQSSITVPDIEESTDLRSDEAVRANLKKDISEYIRLSASLIKLMNDQAIIGEQIVSSMDRLNIEDNKEFSLDLFLVILLMVMLLKLLLILYHKQQ